MVIKEAMTAFAGTLEKVWEHDRTKTVGASEIGLCARRVHWAKREGAKNLDHQETWGARMRGNVMERELWVPALEKKFGKKLLHAGEKQKTFQCGDLSATPDGLLLDPPRNMLAHLGVRDCGPCIMVECKSIDPRVNLNKAKDENAYQVQVQMGVIRERTEHRPEWALITYTDASFWDEITEFAVKFDQATFDAAKKRAAQILRAKDIRDLKPEGWIAGGKECEYCPYTEACGIIRRSVPEKEAAADPQFSAEITEMARQYLELQAAQDAAEAAVRAKQQEIKDRLREKSVRRVPGIVVWSAIKGRVSYNNKEIREAAAEAGVDVEAFSTVGEPTDRLQVSLIPGRNGGPPADERAAKKRTRKR